jgi:hypothetical protein
MRCTEAEPKKLKINEYKGRDEQKSRRPKMSFEKVLAKYKKEVELNVTSRPRKVQSSRLPPKRKSQEWNRQR